MKNNKKLKIRPAIKKKLAIFRKAVLGLREYSDKFQISFLNSSAILSSD
ncbi:MAG: hypothetical protein ABIH38_04310 [Patescibacteria group bacterium]